MEESKGCSLSIAVLPVSGSVEAFFQIKKWTAIAMQILWSLLF